MSTPSRQVRAIFDADTITVYQAYSPAIACRRVAGADVRRAVQARADDLDQAVLPVDDVPLRLGDQGRPGARPRHRDHARGLRVGARACVPAATSPTGARTTTLEGRGSRPAPSGSSGIPSVGLAWNDWTTGRFRSACRVRPSTGMQANGSRPSRTSPTSPCGSERPWPPGVTRRLGPCCRPSGFIRSLPDSRPPWAPRRIRTGRRRPAWSRAWPLGLRRHRFRGRSRQAGPLLRSRPPGRRPRWRRVPPASPARWPAPVS